MLVEESQQLEPDTPGSNAFRWLFLVYVPRSGSTFLSKRLADASSDLLVFPELKTVEIALKIGESKFREMSAREKLEAFQKDPRWASLNLDDGSAESLLSGCDSIKQVMTALAEWFSEQRGIKPKWVVIKNGPSIFMDEAIHDAWGEMTYLHIQRDARGTTASRLRRLSAFHDQADIRATDVWHLAKYWKRLTTTVSQVSKSRGNVIQVQYEDLVRDVDTELEKVFSELDIKAGPSIKSKNVFALSEHEKQAKHVNAEKPAMIERSKAWQTELSKQNGIVIEKLVGLKEPFFLPNSNWLKTNGCLLRAWVRHVMIDVSKIFKRVTG